MRVLVVNAGSSSLKLSVLDGDDVVAQRHVERWDGTGGVAEFLADAPDVDAVGHRVVHGGPDFSGPVVLDAESRAAVERLTDLAPLHQPRALAGIDAATSALPDVPQVACFDTAFHHTMPGFATTYAVPARWRDEWGVRRYGFHGLSHAYASRRAGELAGGSRVVTCHLGAGCSLAAVRDGRSVDTTMGFTPLAGLVMATRSGDVDPGLLVWLLRDGKLSAAELEDDLEHRSGLLGLSGSADLRDVHRAGTPEAALAVEVFVHRLRQAIAAMVASLGGLDVLVFTGGVGEHDAAVRARTVEGLGFLGVAVDQERNAGRAGDEVISADGSSAAVVVVQAREDLEIAAGVRQAVG
ncbi:acetate/propionate family kinase [Actinosynnema sp. NPDC047251]|uniref:Acetate kinase n=1 Tax=Saccharothrix espanaensis (strain ATCC 51144 / DSM 44229 / JCM 9112 / NBRC 15066 / NRRL 15764) TaxID=1179773 RepID=K0K0R0_SACES|nr:acetate/propionate family kinase [Saccharothrix espanaensis]CCH31097.1 Acetate kinase [Saccharothrix espanaensis DSM 44229]